MDKFERCSFFGAPFSFLSFFYYMNLEVVKVDGIDKVILIKSRFAVPLKFFNGRVEPDWLAKVKLIADIFKGAEYFVRPCIVGVIADNGISQHAVVFKFFSP